MSAPTIYAEISSRIRRLKNDESGNIAVIFVLALLPVMGSVGMAVDYSRANSVRTAMQAAVDSTALALAKNASSLSSTQITQQATDRFSALFIRPEATGVQINAQYDTDKKTLSLAATGSVKTDFMGVMGYSSLNIGVRAVAMPAGEGTACVLALNASVSGAATAQGNPDIKLDGCSLYDNSSSTSALTVGGSAKLSALSVGVVGGVSGNAAITTAKGVSTGITPVPDPYKSLAVPVFSGCNANDFTAKTTVTINPGVYCGGMKINANANVTLNPGIYYIDRGDLSVNGNATMTGTGVTLIFTSSTMTNWPTVTINGGATINLTAPTTGATAGMVMFGDRNIPLGTLFKFNGGSSQYLGGAVYFPTGDVTFSGGAGTSTSCTQLIADTIKWAGNSNFAINCKGSGTKPFGPAGVRLVS